MSAELFISAATATRSCLKSMPDAPNSAMPAAEQETRDCLDLWDFFEYFVELNRVSLTTYGAHKDICELYQAAIVGEMPGYQYFIINMPRRIGKTKRLEALPCWMFGEFPEAQMIYSCYSDPLVGRSMAYIAQTVQKPWFTDLYGDRLHTITNRLITTTAGGSLYGAGTGATITGFGAGLKEVAGGFIAMDDPAKPDEALSKVESGNVIQNFETTFKGCRNSDKYT